MSVFVSLFVEDSSANTSNRYNRPCDDASPQTASAICVKDPVSFVTDIVANSASHIFTFLLSLVRLHNRESKS